MTPCFEHVLYSAPDERYPVSSLLLAATGTTSNIHITRLRYMYRQEMRDSFQQTSKQHRTHQSIR